jgi:two-component system sensor histidine kinase KdpD
MSERPDPDELLARIQADEELANRAKLKIFFGASAGVGKTYAMLVEAHERQRAGVDVAVGWVETHGRHETAALLDGLEILPRGKVEYRGAGLEEFDLDGALERTPALLLLDELAHTNAPGSRHRQRWQDVQELLGAGIDVYTTLNVQHIESLYDVVAEITGVRQRETLPDSIVDRADEIELVDLPPDDLLQRLREGKVHVPEQIGRAVEHFFRKGNLIALRELALRRVAARVDAQMEHYRRTQGIARSWAVGGRMIVGVGDPASATKLIRAARRLAESLKAEWVVVHVERPGEPARGKERDHLLDVLGFASELGAETAILSGPRVVDELTAYAKSRNASRIVVGKPTRPRWLEALIGSLVSTLVRRSNDIDVLVLSAEHEAVELPPVPRAPEGRLRWQPYGQSALAVFVCTGIALVLQPWFERANLVMLYLLGVMWVAVSLGRGPAVVASFLSVVAFDFFIVPPLYTFAVSDTQYLVTFAVMLLASILIGTLAARLQTQVKAARVDEHRSDALARLSGELVALHDRNRILEVLLRHLEDVFESRGVVLLPDARGRLEVAAGDPALLGAGAHERGVAQWAFDNGQAAGLGTATLPGSRCLHLPLRGSQRELGVIALEPRDIRSLMAPDSFRLLRAFGNHAALALERSALAEQAERARVQSETERLRSGLLSSVSHDLRTPLAVITGAASTLLEDEDRLDAAAQREMLRSIADEAARLNRLVTNLLAMTRLEAGALEVKRSWHSLEEVVGAALHRLEPLLGGRPVRVGLPAQLPLVAVDEVLLEQVVFNLLENAVKHAPSSTPIEIEARVRDHEVELSVADRGPGLLPGSEEQVFEKFYRGDASRRAGGVGLGLAICRGIVEAHGGRLRAANRPDGGAAFSFTLPLDAHAPVVEPEPSLEPPHAETRP